MFGIWFKIEEEEKGKKNILKTKRIKLIFLVIILNKKRYLTLISL